MTGRPENPVHEMGIDPMAKSTKTAARTTKIAATKIAPVAPATVAHQSAYIAKCATMGVLPASGDGLPARETFRNLLRAAGKWVNGSTQWGAHNVVTDLHDFAIARMVRRRGDAASPAARKFADAIIARFGETFVPAQWDIDVAAHRAAFTGEPAAKSRRTRTRRAA